MTLWVCRKCTAKFAVGLAYCPQCTSTDCEEEGSMPKITVHGGVTDKTVQPKAGVVDVTDEPVPGAADFGDADAPELDAVAERPSPSASKADWVEYAVARGHDRADAEALTRAKLIDLYGPAGSPA